MSRALRPDPQGVCAIAEQRLDSERYRTKSRKLPTAAGIGEDEAGGPMHGYDRADQDRNQQDRNDTRTEAQNERDAACGFREHGEIGEPRRQADAFEIA